jgi:mono/diheme cytochrome c family protein
VFGVSSYRMNQRIAFTDTAPTIPNDSATVARGQYLARAIAKCVDCHGEDLGGKVAVDAGPVGMFYGPNLTSGTGSATAALSDAEIVHGIRHGVGKDGRKLLFMPAAVWTGMSDDDVAAIVAYIRSLPAVDRASPPSVVKPLGRLLYLAGQFPLFEAELIDHTPPHRVAPPAGPDAQYGQYLANIGGCTGCHTPSLSGGHVPGTPPNFKPAANITPDGIGHYTEADFFRAMRDARRPDGSAIDPFMPTAATKLMTDDDTRAIWRYLMTVPRKKFGER